MHVTAIIAAGGRGRRFGTSVPKQLLAVADRPLLERSVALFLEHPEVHELVVALPSGVFANPPEYLLNTTKALRMVEGGLRRQDSVARAFEVISAATDVIVVHDAARPFASPRLVSRTIAAAREAGAAIAALPARDTVKRARLSGGSVVVDETLPRESIYLAQTPQAFSREVLKKALASSAASLDATDEALLVERAGFPVKLVEGEVSNIKITTPEDLAAAEQMARSAQRARTGRAGTGYDLHRLVPGRPLVIGGIVIPADVGPLAHSDGDVVCHALTDAILGAAGRGDIGRHFPDSDPRWQNSSSLDLLGRAAAMVAESGFGIGNVDVTVILEKTKIKDHVERMRDAVAGALGIGREQVSIKGKTNEGLDAVGRGEAIAAHAIALLRAR
jgi:2-C-methyl-D-erythritol 4-phosphate cytidylyltransferase/2-C-methyl-D-erythritol 2,4-cyclodiphosphate synthase